MEVSAYDKNMSLPLGGSGGGEGVEDSELDAYEDADPGLMGIGAIIFTKIVCAGAGRGQLPETGWELVR